MDEQFYLAYDETHGTNYAASSVYSGLEAGADIPENVLREVRKLETMLNSAQYGEPWTLVPKEIVADRQGKQVCLCVLNDSRSGGRYQLRLPLDNYVQGLYDWVESMYRQLRRLFHGLREWEKEETRSMLEEFEQLPEGIKRAIARRYSQEENGK